MNDESPPRSGGPGSTGSLDGAPGKPDETGSKPPKYRWADEGKSSSRARPARRSDGKDQEPDAGVPEPAGATSAKARDGRRRWKVAIAVAVPLIMIAAFALSRAGKESQEPGGEDPLVRYCAAVVEKDSIQLPNPARSDSEEVQNLVPVVAGRLVLLTERMLEVAPEGAKAGLRKQEQMYRDLVRSRDAAGFQSAELKAAQDEVYAVDVRSCQLKEVEFSAIEFQYQGVPGQVEHGRTSIAMRNEGSEPHEMFLYRRKDEFGGDFTRILRREAQDEEATPVASVYAAPGATGRIVTDLVGGEYAMVCMLRSGNQAHWQRGMIAEFIVE